MLASMTIPISTPKKELPSTISGTEGTRIQNQGLKPDGSLRFQNPNLPETITTIDPERVIAQALEDPRYKKPEDTLGETFLHHEDPLSGPSKADILATATSRPR